MMRKGMIAACFFALFSIFCVGQEDMELLDLTVRTEKVFHSQRPPLQPGEVEYNGGIGDEPRDGKPPKSPVAITLERVDKPVYQIGDLLVYEVTVENVSSEDVMIPTSRNEDERDVVYGARISGNSKSYAKALVDLHFADGKLDESLTLTTLYGVTALPQSFRVLHPGRKLRIRDKEKVYFGDSDFRKRLAAETPKKVELRASLTLYVLDSYLFNFVKKYKTAVSSNSVMIELRKYEPPDQSPSQ
jgi:hypothetical protein